MICAVGDMTGALQSDDRPAPDRQSTKKLHMNYSHLIIIIIMFVY